jgi:hypothetical protein
LETNYLFTENVTSGDYFRFRYRSLNVNGWSDFSPISHIKSATIPQRPNKPTFISATSDSISLFFYESYQDGGQTITEYEL